MELVMNEQPVPEELIRKTLREATLHNVLVPVLCGSALNKMGVQPVLDAVGAYLPSPLDMPPVEGINPQRRTRQAKISRKPRARRALLRAGLQDRGRQPRRPALRPRLFRPAEGQQPRAQPGQGQEGKRAAALADPGRRAEAGRSGRGGRHHRRHRSSRTRSPATRSATPTSRSCWNRSSFPRRSFRWPSSRKARPSGRSWPTCWT